MKNLTLSDTPLKPKYEYVDDDHSEIKDARKSVFFPGGTENLTLNVHSQRDVDARRGDFMAKIEALGWEATPPPQFKFVNDGDGLISWDKNRTPYRRKL